MKFRNLKIDKNLRVMAKKCLKVYFYKKEPKLMRIKINLMLVINLDL